MWVWHSKVEAGERDLEGAECKAGLSSMNSRGQGLVL